MNSAKKDRIVQIEQKLFETETTYNEKKYTWVPKYSNVYAALRPLRGKEVIAAAQTMPESQRQYTIDYFSDIDETMRVVDDKGIGWNIIYIAEGKRGAELELTCMRPGEETDSDGVN